MTYKVCVYWDAWTPKIETRILRDMFSLQRLARVQQDELLIAADQSIVSRLKQMGLKVSKDFKKPNLIQVYLNEGTEIPEEVLNRLPEHAEPTVVSLQEKPIETPDLIVEKDPYAGVKLHKDWYVIPPTMPLGKPPPKGDSEPMYSPWL